MAEYTCPTQKRGENVSIKMGIIIDMIPISISIVVYIISVISAIHFIMAQIL